MRPVWGLLLLAAVAPVARAGLSFDTGATPEEACDLLARPGQPTAPADSWLRLRNMDNSFVRDGTGAEVPLWSAAKPEHSLAERRAALEQLQSHGFHLVALLRWDPASWPHGIRTEHPLRRLPIDLRDAFDRCRALAANYGDLIDYWEIDNEPDISFVEENPETYAAFLKACYFGIAAGRPQAGGERSATGELEGQKAGGSEASASVHPTIRPSGPQAFRPSAPLASGIRHPDISTRSRVLMAPLALPPGPYLTAFIANGGLRYTDGFNYHYYGYASDFTGVYEQFRDAIMHASVPDLPPNVAVLNTRFYPNTSNWSSAPVFNFDFPAPDAATHRAQLEARPSAEGEPKLIPQGRWLVSSGVSVEELPGLWRIRVDHLPAEPLRPAMAELPLPDGWKPDLNALLSFIYRTVPPEELEAEGRMPDAGRRTPEAREPDDQKLGRSESQTPEKPKPRSSDHSTILPSEPPASGVRPPVSAPRLLPIFLTEYGYGLLSKETRDTSEGRTRQAAWFNQVQSQIHTLGLTRAMAFLLTPYLENDRQEFGLLMKADTGDQTPDAGYRRPEAGEGKADGSKSTSTLRPPASGIRPPASVLWPSGLRPSPALSTLLADSATPVSARSWSTSEPQSQTSIVIDFVAGAGLNQQKSYTGYLARGDYGRPGQPASGHLVLYNFGITDLTGDLQLAGDSWTLVDTSRSATLTLAPGERRELAVLVTPAPLFAPQPVTATFRPSTSSPLRPSDLQALRSSGPLASGIRDAASAVPAAQPEVRAIATTEPGQLPFDVYLRTANGNLYSAGPTLAATETAQSHGMRLGNLTLAFFGRAESPWAFARNEPAALVFYVRPGSLPVELEITRPSVVKLTAP